MKQRDPWKEAEARVTLNSPCLFNPFSTPNKWATRLLKIMTRKRYWTRQVAVYNDFDEFYKIHVFRNE